MLWHLCASFRLGAAWTTDDAFQEVLCELWRWRSTFRGASTERTWVYRVAMSTLLGISRRHSNQPSPAVGDASTLPPVTTPPAEPSVLLQLVATLTDDEQYVVRAHLDGFSNIEIGRMTGLSPAAVSMRLSRAKRKLKKMYLDEIH